METQDPKQKAENLAVLREKVEEVLHSLKVGKSSSELLKNGGEARKVLTAICQKILETKEWPKDWTHSVVIC